MKYFIYDPLLVDTPPSFFETPDLLKQDYVEGLKVIYAEGFNAEDAPYVRIVDGVPILGERIKYVSGSDIKATWKMLEQEPVIVGDFYVHGDDESIKRMQQTIAAFDDLDLIEDQLIEIHGVRYIRWKMVNGIFTFGKNDLESLYATFTVLRTKRNAILFKNYQNMKTSLPVSEQYLKDKTNWFK